MTTKAKITATALAVFSILGTNAILLNEQLNARKSAESFSLKLVQNIESTERRLSEIESRISKIESLRIDVPADLKERVETRFREVADEISAQASKSIQTALDYSKESQALHEQKILEIMQAGDASVKNDQEIRRKELHRALALAESERKDFATKMDAVVENSANRARNSLDRLSEEYLKALSQTVTNLNELATTRITGDKLAAQRAVESARELRAKGEFENAKIYCLNAITHTPSEAAYFQELFEIQSNIQNQDIGEWQTLSAMLSDASSWVAPESIPQMRELATKVNQKIEEATNRISEEEENAQRTKAENALNELSGKYAWSNFETVSNKVSWLRERYDVLDATVDDEQESLKTSSTLTLYLHLSDAKRALAKAEETLKGALVATSDINDKIRSSRDAELASVASQIQVVEGILPQIWVLDFSEMYDSEAVKKTVAEFSERLLAVEDEYSRQISREYTEKAEATWNQIEAVQVPSPKECKPVPADDAQEGVITQKIKNLEELIEKFNEALAKIVCPKTIEAFHKKIKDKNVDKVIYELNLLRKVLYNEWAIKKIKYAYLAKDEANQKDYLKNVNQTLLNPAVSSLYATVYGKHFSENADAQIEITKANKIGLEQF